MPPEIRTGRNGEVMIHTSTGDKWMPSGSKGVAPTMNNRERNALVAEKVMGWRWCLVRGALYLEDPAGWRAKRYTEVPADSYQRWEDYDADVPDYSTDIAAAWPLMERLADDGYVLGKAGTPSRWGVFVAGSDGPDDWISDSCDTAPLAICLAALKAYGATPE